MPLAAIAKTAADVRRLRKEAPVPVWTPEQPVPDSFEGFTIYPKDLVGHETHEVGNFAAFPQIRGGLTSTLTVCTSRLYPRQHLTDPADFCVSLL